MFLSVHLFPHKMILTHLNLRDPLPAKHLEEQTGTKTYDLWCRKGGGTWWQDIKATDLYQFAPIFGEPRHLPPRPPEKRFLLRSLAVTGPTKS